MVGKGGTLIIYPFDVSPEHLYHQRGSESLEIVHQSHSCTSVNTHGAVAQEKALVPGLSVTITSCPPHRAWGLQGHHVASEKKIGFHIKGP